MKSNYGWVVVAVGALMTCVGFGSVFSLAVLLQPMGEATGWSRRHFQRDDAGVPRDGRGRLRMGRA